MVLFAERWDSVDYLKTPEEQAAYLEAAAEENDSKLFAYALGQVARARGMTEVAKEAGVSRVGLYQSLTREGDPRLSTVPGVLKALDLSLSIKPAA